ncbi:hypothetical protein BGM19_02055 [Streptomyces agglomeratus]|uniref:BlaI/MecI/CopY family transcriptional regulator n=1 Tax=Streptomyces agglomeratus TaxID=285458 RepID=UPI00085284E5|nr:BlaI/MecI/CopY family transcriptional regulator [Streptomyces agglomeratus]OEJ56983.1 hypothetical protein BGM19_02055 [Streptomyces agglomeratus]
MAEEPDNPPIQSKYAQQYGADLAANREEQERLAERLKQLQADEAWLLQQLEAKKAGAPAKAAASQTVPQQRREAAKATPVPSNAKKKTTRAKTPAKRTHAPKAKAGGDKATVKKTTVEKATQHVAETAKRAEPPLHEVVLSILRTQPGHPHLAREVHTELADKHRRSASIQVVRNSLESLVKKGMVEKENKQNSVMYTAPTGRTVESVPEAAAEKASEKVTADA